MTSREIQTAVQLMLTGDLAKHAIAFGSKSVMQFTISNYANMQPSSKPEDSSEKSPSGEDEGEESDGSFTVENLS